MQKLTVKIQGMEGVQSEVKIVAKLKTLSGVMLVNIDFARELGVITFDECKVKAITIVKAINSLGYSVTSGARGTWRAVRIFFGVAAFLALCILVLELFPSLQELVSTYVYKGVSWLRELLQP